MSRRMFNQYREATGKRQKEKLKVVIFGLFNPKDFEWADVSVFNGEFNSKFYYDAILCFTKSVPREAFDLAIIYQAKIFHLTPSLPSATLTDIRNAQFLRLKP